MKHKQKKMSYTKKELIRCNKKIEEKIDEIIMKSNLVIWIEQYNW